MNTNQRGQKQNESIIFRCAPADKANVKLEANRRGVNMSGLIKALLIDARIIEPVNGMADEF